MDICIITDDASKMNSHFMKDIVRLLEDRHSIRVLITRSLVNTQTLVQEALQPRADLYLLKCHVPCGLEVGRQLEAAGALVMNSWQATLRCQDRALVAELMESSGIPWPRTWSLPRFQASLTEELLNELPYPVIVKARYAYEGEYVDRADTREQLEMLATYWSEEPVIVQECLTSDGWDTKVWSIDGEIFPAKRRSPLDDKPRDKFQIPLSELGEEIQQHVLKIGRAFDLHIYVVDFLLTENGPYAIDVNTFPAFNGLIGPDKAMARFVERLAHEQSDKKGVALV